MRFTGIMPGPEFLPTIFSCSWEFKQDCLITITICRSQILFCYQLQYLWHRLLCHSLELSARRSAVNVYSSVQVCDAKKLNSNTAVGFIKTSTAVLFYKIKKITILFSPIKSFAW